MNPPASTAHELDLSERIVAFPCSGRALPPPRPQPIEARTLAVHAWAFAELRCSFSLGLLLLALGEAEDKGRVLTAGEAAAALCRPAQAVLSQISADRYLFHLEGRSIPSTVVQLSEDGVELLARITSLIEQASTDPSPHSHA